MCVGRRVCVDRVARRSYGLLRDLVLGGPRRAEAGGFRSSFFRRGVARCEDAERHTAQHDGDGEQAQAVIVSPVAPPRTPARSTAPARHGSDLRRRI